MVMNISVNAELSLPVLCTLINIMLRGENIELETHQDSRGETRRQIRCSISWGSFVSLPWVGERSGICSNQSSYGQPQCVADLQSLTLVTAHVPSDPTNGITYGAMLYHVGPNQYTFKCSY